MAGKTRKNPSKNGATLGFEAQPCAAISVINHHAGGSGLLFR
jgi:hypothetical protein